MSETIRDTAYNPRSAPTVFICILRQEMPDSHVPQLAQVLQKSARGGWRAWNRSGRGFGKCI